MIGFIISIIAILIFSIILILPNTKQFIPAVGFSMYLIPFYNLFSPIFGISIPFFLQAVLLFYFLLMIVFGPANNYMSKIFKKSEVKAIFAFIIFLFLNHIYFGSSYRHDPYKYTFAPIIYFTTISLLIQYSINLKISFEKLLKHIRIIFWTNIIIGGFSLLFTDLYFHGNIELSKNVGFNINMFAMRCVQLVLFELFFLRKRTVFRIFLIFTPVILCLMTGSRSGFIVLILVLIYWFINSREYRVSYFLIIPTIIIFLTFNFNFLFERFFNIGDAINNSDLQSIFRFQLIMRGLYIFLDFPLIGAGIGTFHQFRHAYFETIAIGRSDSFVDSHNLYVQILAETGLIGFILFIAIFYFLFKKIKKLKRINTNAYSFLMGNIILYMFSGLFHHDLYRYYLLIPILLGAIYSENYFKSKKISRT